MTKQSNFEKQLQNIIGAEQEIEETHLDQLEDEEGEDEEEQTKLPEKVEYETVPTKHEQQETDKFDDYVYARSVLYGLIERGTTALEGSIMVARESEHPRAYEVASTLMKNVSDMSKELINLHDKMNDGGGAPTNQYNTQNNYYTNGGSSEDDVNNVLDDLEDDKDKGQ